jgi:hypothetical protein
MKKILMSSFSISIGVGVFIAALATGGLAQTAPQGTGMRPAATQAPTSPGARPRFSQIGSVCVSQKPSGCGAAAERRG